MDRFKFETCSHADIDEISRLAVEAFGPTAASADRNKFLLSIDGRSYWKLGDEAGCIVGYFCLFRLAQAGMQAINSGEFGITTCPREFLVGDENPEYRHHDLYVGGILGLGFRARGLILGALKRRLAEMRPRNVLARAASADGRRLLEHLGASALDPVRTGVGEFYHLAQAR